MSFIIYKTSYTTKDLYMCNYIYISMKLNNKLINHNIHPISFEIYSFIGIVKTYYDLPSNVTDRIVDIFATIDNNYHDFFGTVRYENVVLAATIFAVREFQQHFVTKSPPFDITDFVIQLYGQDRTEPNIKHIYNIYLKIQYMFGQTESPIETKLLLPVVQ